MGDLQNIFSVVLQILNKPFVVLGFRITLLSVVIGLGVLGIVLSFVFGVFDD